MFEHHFELNAIKNINYGLNGLGELTKKVEKELKELSNVLSAGVVLSLSANDYYLTTQNLLTSNFTSNEEQITELKEFYDLTQSNTIILNVNYLNSKCVTQLSSSAQHVVDAKMSRSTSDLNSINVDVDSVNSSPGLLRRHSEEVITFESFRKFLNDNADQKMKNAKRIQLVESYKTIAFEDLVNRQERKFFKNFHFRTS